MLVVNHDWMKLCKDRKLPEWLTKLLERSDGAETVAAEDLQLYCLCMRPWQGRLMIQSDRCDEWYHGTCVNVTPSEALNIDQKNVHNVGQSNKMFLFSISRRCNMTASKEPLTILEPKLIQLIKKRPARESSTVLHPSSQICCCMLEPHPI